MTQSRSSWLACPRCREPLEEKAAHWHCPRCAQDYPVVDGIARFLRPEDERSIPAPRLDRESRRTRERFAWEWERYPGSLEEDRGIFLQETQISAELWKDRLALDAGCGMGRYSRVALSLGAEVVAFDLSDALRRLSEEARREGRLHLVQGDLLTPPFRERVFDIVFSQGVLHHTADTEAAFRSVARLVKPGGLLSVWVYGKPGNLRDFRSNPLRPGREGLARVRLLVWMLVWLRIFLSDFVRALTTRLPTRVLYGLCFPLAWLGAVPGLKYLTFSAHPDFRVRLHENFDWLAPPYQHKHTKEELRSWFESEGFSRLRLLPHGFVPKIGIAGIKT